MTVSAALLGIRPWHHEVYEVGVGRRGLALGPSLGPTTCLRGDRKQTTDKQDPECLLRFEYSPWILPPRPPQFFP